MLEQVLEFVKLLIAGSPSPSPLSDEVLTIYVQQAHEEAISYCNVKELPESAATAIAFLAVDMLAANSLSNNISSMSEGGRSVSFETGAQTVATVKPEHRKALDRYRKARCI